MSDPRPHAVELHCGCRPLFHQPVPAVGSRITCSYHQRGATVVAHHKPPAKPPPPPDDRCQSRHASSRARCACPAGHAGGHHDNRPGTVRHWSDAGARQDVTVGHSVAR